MAFEFRVEGFCKIRKDGLALPEDMSVSAMVEMGWAPCPVVEAQWSWGGRRCQISCPQGLLAHVVADRQHVVSLEENEAGDVRLFVTSGDGSARREVCAPAWLGGRLLQGRYLWLERSLSMPGSAFCVVFEAKDDLAMRYLVFDAATGELLQAQYFR